MDKEEVKEVMVEMAENVAEKGKVIIQNELYVLTATALMLWAGLDADIWGMIAMCYIGGQSTIDFAKAWKHG